MARVDIELNPVDFVTIGTVGPKGRRVFHLQAGRADQVVSLTVEKEQTRALAEALDELLDDLQKQLGDTVTADDVGLDKMNMELREPIEPEFRVAQMGLGYDRDHDMIVLVAQELVATQEEEDPEEAQPGIARFWCTRQQMRALSKQAGYVVKQGRVDPQSNGRLLYYWT